MAKKRKIGILLSEAELKRRYPDSALASEIFVNDDNDSLVLPCRVLPINHHLGGGIRYGKIVENSGEESVGKTLLAMDFGVVAQSMGGIVLWDDAEATFDPKWAEAHGLDMKKLVLLQYENRFEVISDWIADMIPYWRSKLVNNEPILLVCDSIAVLEGSDSMETAQMDSKAEMGRRSFLMGQMLRKRTRFFAKYGVCVYFINQIRSKIGASKFEDPDTTPLSQCMKYYAAQRFGIYRGKRLKHNNDPKGRWVGNMVYIRTKKSKVSVPRDNIKSRVFFRNENGKFGYDRYYGFPELLEAKKIITIVGQEEKAKYTYKGKLLAKGEENFLHLLATNTELRSKFIKKLGVHTPSAFRNKLASINKNLYPVKGKKQKANEKEKD